MNPREIVDGEEEPVTALSSCFRSATQPPRDEKGKKEERKRKKKERGEEKKESLLRSTSVKNAISVFTRCLRVSYELAERVLELYPPPPSIVYYR